MRLPLGWLGAKIGALADPLRNPVARVTIRQPITGSEIVRLGAGLGRLGAEEVALQAS